MVKQTVKGKKELLLTSVLQEWANGVVPGKYALVKFFEAGHVDLYASNTWAAMKDALDIFQQEPDEPWGRMQWGDKPWQSIDVKDKWEFLDTYITPVIEKGRPLITQYDQLRSPGSDVIEAFDRIAAAKAVGRPAKPEGAPVEHRPATLAKAAKVKELRAKGMTQQQVADELGADRSTVAKIESSVNKKGANSTIKSHTDKPQSIKRGSTAKSWTIAKLKREGKDDIAAQVESGAMSAAEARRQVFGEKPAKTFSVGPTTDPQDFALRLKEGLSDEFLAKLTAALNELVLSNLG
jgi:DNA-binding XRE family transcriptional regulator